MNIDRKNIWPRKGKLKKAAIILAIVVAAALIKVLVEEKFDIRVRDKVMVPIALVCVGIWFYQPASKSDTETKNYES